MIARGRDKSGKMPCESCAVQFSVFKRKRACSECERYYCSGCLRRGGGTMCAPCRVLSTRPLARQNILHLKVRDLQCFLHRQNVSTRGCVEKEELLSLCVSHVNSAAYSRHGPRGSANPFCSLKGITNNINVFISSAFDLQRAPQPAPPPPRSCYNGSHSHTAQPRSTTTPPSAPPRARPERFSTTPGGEQDIFVPVPLSESGSSLTNSSDQAARVDTADCFEIEDLDDQGWEVVHTPAEPLPNDSEVLLSTAENVALRRESVPQEIRIQREEPTTLSIEIEREWDEDPGVGIILGIHSVGRAASELDLRTHSTEPETETTSLQDEQLMNKDKESPRHISLDQFSEMSELESLNVKQLKELLTRNRVEFKGCLERADLLNRAQTLWRNHNRDKDEVDKLPMEECCKICMAAPLECVLLECGHIAACTDCSKQLAECPICRQYVVRAVRFFRS